MARVPHANTAISAARNEFWSAELGAFAANAIDSVAHLGVRLHLVLGLASFDVIDVQNAFHVDGCDIAD